MQLEIGLLLRQNRVRVKTWAKINAKSFSHGAAISTSELDSYFKKTA